MVLPALQVRVPNPANALLQAEQIKGVRAQAQERERRGQVRNALLSAFQGGIPTEPAAQAGVVNQIARVDPLAALSIQAELRQANAAAPGFTLTPGAARFDAQGNPVASVPAAPRQPTAFERRVSELKLRGFTDEEAQDIAAGRMRIATDPVTGNSRVVNVATGEAKDLTAGQPAPGAPVLTAEERGRIFNQNAAIERVLGLSEGLEESAATASGPIANLGALANSLAGLLGRNAPLPADEIAAARQDIRLFNQIAKTAIVNNPRFPVAEQQVVERMLPNPDAFFTNPSGEFNKMLQLQDFLRNIQAQNNQSLGIAPSSPSTGAQEGATATNPTTGERIIFRNGRWEPL